MLLRRKRVLNGRSMLRRGKKYHNSSKFIFSLVSPAWIQGDLCCAPNVFQVVRTYKMRAFHFCRIGALNRQAEFYEEEQRALGMLEHLAHASCEGTDHRRRTRARGNSSARAV